jgi:hypothetical protein
MDNEQWDFLDFQDYNNNNKYIPYLSQEYNPLQPHDYHKVVDLVKKFKRDLERKEQVLEHGKVEPLSEKAALIKSENGDDAFKRRGGIQLLKEDAIENSRVLLFYRIVEEKDERVIKSRILKMVEPFGKILQIELDRVPDYIGLPPEDNLRVYVKFKDSISSRKGKSLRSSYYRFFLWVRVNLKLLV